MKSKYSHFSACISFMMLLFSASSSSQSKCSDEVFRCTVKAPYTVEFKLCRVSQEYYIPTLIVNGNSVLTDVTVGEFVKSSYHRSLVNQHSFGFFVNNKNIIISDYKSDEFSESIRELTIELSIDNNKKTLYCENSSSSSLAEIKNTLESAGQ